MVIGWIHALMEDTQDPDPIRLLPINNQMNADRECSISVGQVVAHRADLRVP